MGIGILELLRLEPSEQSKDYVENKTQFHLYNLLTEQRHEQTWNLSFALKRKTEDGVGMILAVDRDISRKMIELESEDRILQQAVSAVSDAILKGRRIYVYGCGATGRLAKQLESALWRPFWIRIKQSSLWPGLQQRLPESIEEMLIGEMTGGDRALVSALEGFEDLLLIGERQLIDRGIQPGDVVFCVTEGGETSSVIGTILAALQQYGDASAAECSESEHRLFFVYNNPDDRLRPLERSVKVIDNPRISKINLATGPQAITGSTRLQATTSETFVLGIILEQAIDRVLKQLLTADEMQRIGFQGNRSIGELLQEFALMQKAVETGLAQIAAFTDLEAHTYFHGGFSTYFAKEALITVFIDGAERSPTFRLFPLDKITEPERKCWFQVWTEAETGREAWKAFLGRPFRGLKRELYLQAFATQIDDCFLREAALRSLAQAGDEQENLYDFSMSADNLQRRGLKKDDLGVIVLLGEEPNELLKADSSFHRFLMHCRENGARIVIVSVGGDDDLDRAGAWEKSLERDVLQVHLRIPNIADPLGLRRQIALKMLLNAHSTAVMTLLGRTVGNTMTYVSPSNLKLIGRATYLIMTHVNDVLAQGQWKSSYGPAKELSFAEANAVLLDSIQYITQNQIGQTAEVALSIIRILEAFRRNGPVSWSDALEVLEKQGLEQFLWECNPRLRT